MATGTSGSIARRVRAAATATTLVASLAVSLATSSALLGASGATAADAPSAPVGAATAAADPTAVPDAAAPDAVAPTAGPVDNLARELKRTNAAQWQAAGYKGGGVKIGLVGTFDLAAWNAAQAKGGVGAPGDVACQVNGAGCDLWASGAGGTADVAAAEVVHVLAPDAQLFLGTAVTGDDLHAVVSWMASKGVTILVRLHPGVIDGRGDGTGATDAAIADAGSRGILVLSAAGDFGNGGYLRRTWSDGNSDGFLDGPGGDPLIPVTCGKGAFVGLRWDDFGAAVGSRADYDVVVYDSAGRVLAVSANDQTAGAAPIELLNGATCVPGETVSVGISQIRAGAANAPLELFVVNGKIDGASASRSASLSGTDAAAPAMSIGAMEPSTGTTIAPYSPLGPTTDGRSGIDLVAPACLKTWTTGATCVNGTAAAAAAVAGVAALAQDAGKGPNPAALRAYLMNAAINRGSAFTYGSGEVALSLPVPLQPPTAPLAVTAGAGDKQAFVSFSPPADPGNAPITTYTVTVSPGGAKVNGTSSPITVPNLTNGTAYTFTVTAISAAGTSPASAPSNAVTPSDGKVNPGPGPVSGPGYWMLDASARVYGFGSAQVLSTMTVNPAAVRAVHIEPTPSRKGYWLLTSDGVVHEYGDAAALGSVTTPLAAGEQVSTMSTTPTGAGYWVFTNRGRAINFGDAKLYTAPGTNLTDLSSLTLNGPIVGSVATASGRGYFMVASDGGIFAFGDAGFRGSMGGATLNAPVQSLVPTTSGRGYWLVASDGGIFAFGDAPFRGSMGGQPLNRPVVGMVRFGNGYLMVGEDGGIFNFSNLPFLGSLGSNPPANPVVSVAGIG